jgi:ribose 5-phosphate isomerase A
VTTDAVAKEQAEAEKRLAAEAAALLVESGMRVGLGTGTTVLYLLPALAKRNLDLRCVSTSPRTEVEARQLGIPVEPFTLDQLDIAIDGADQIDPRGWLIKGGGAAQTREKLVAVTADRFVVIADSSKLVDALHPPVPLELLGFGLESTLKRLDEGRLGDRRLGEVRLRDVPPSPDGGVIADLVGPIDDPEALARYLEHVPGVVEHGLFPPELVSTVIIGRDRTTETIDMSSPRDSDS